MGEVATAADTGATNAHSRQGAKFWAPRIGIAVVAVGLIAAGVYAVATPETASANTAGQQSWPCNVATDQIATLAAHPSGKLTAATGTCVLALGEAETQLAALAPSVVTYNVQDETGKFDPRLTETTTWDGTTGVVKVAGTSAMYLSKTGGSSLTGESYTQITNVSEILRDLTASIKLGASKVTKVAWTSKNNTTTWDITLKDQRSSLAYQLTFNDAGHLIATAECPKSCTPKGPGNFETIAPFSGSAAVSAQTWAAERLAFARGIAASVKYLLDDDLIAGKSWGAALTHVLKTPDGLSAPGPAPVSHVAAVAESKPGNAATIFVNLFGEVYTFDVAKEPLQPHVTATRPTAPIRVSAAQAQALAAVVASDIAERASTNPVQKTFKDKLAEAVAGPSANGLVVPTSQFIDGHLSMTGPRAALVTIPIAGRTYRITFTETSSGTVIAGSPTAID